jgi:hypothetical protein
MGMTATFPKRRKSLIATAVTVAAAGAVAAAAIPASAAGLPPGPTATTHVTLADRADNAVGPAHAGSGAPARTLLATSLRGANEVPVAGAPAGGDEDGTALEFVEVRGDRVSVAVTWQGTARPTRLDLHQGAKGENGDVRIDFSRLLHKAAGHRVTGTVTVDDPALLAALTSDPGSFYADLHTRAYPGGALRGQLHPVTVAAFDFRDALRNVQASVVEGKQIYECKPADGGGYAFAQRDVDARLRGGIHHTYTAPNSGVPQWVAQDGSAVTGAALSRTPNGAGNIPELDLKATSSGKDRGVLADTTEVLRLNTVGGLAPTGSCTPGAITEVPYRADYVFLRG